MSVSFCTFVPPGVVVALLMTMAVGISDMNMLISSLAQTAHQTDWHMDSCHTLRCCVISDALLRSNGLFWFRLSAPDGLFLSSLFKLTQSSF